MKNVAVAKEYLENLQGLVSRHDRNAVVCLGLKQFKRMGCRIVGSVLATCRSRSPIKSPECVFRQLARFETRMFARLRFGIDHSCE